MNYKILIVDDEVANLRLLERLFRRQYQVIGATSGAEALELLRLHDIALIISDQRMPGMTGIEFLKRAAEMRPNTVRVILTGYTDVNALVEAINSGVVYKYVSKPWVNEDLQQTAARGLEHYETIKARHELQVRNNRLTTSLDAARRAFIRVIGDTLAARDETVRGHLQRTANYAAAIGHRFDLEAAEIEQLRLAAYLHETGRMIGAEGGADEFSVSPDEENRLAGRRAERGSLVLSSFPDMEDAAAFVRYHAERYYGTGSPEGLSGEQIPLGARIIAVAKAYDEMTGKRGDAALSHDEAIERLSSEAGRRFDPAVVEAFGNIEAIGQIRRAIEDGVVGMRLPHSRVLSDAGAFSTAELLHKFKTEPLLALDVLKIANSLGDVPTARLLPAMSQLGEDRLRLLVRQHGLPAFEEKNGRANARAARRAVAAQLLAAQTSAANPEDAYALGLLAEIGENLLLNLFPNEMLALEKTDESVRARRQIEVFGLDAAQVSRWMLEACRLPRELTDALEAPDSEMSNSEPLALLMSLAEKIARADDAGGLVSASAIGTDVLTPLNLSRADLRAVFDRTNSITEEQFIARQEIFAPAQSIGEI